MVGHNSGPQCGSAAGNGPADWQATSCSRVVIRGSLNHQCKNAAYPVNVAKNRLATPCACSNGGR